MGDSCGTRNLDNVWNYLQTNTEPPRFHFSKPENYISMYHQEGTDTLYVGGQANIYVLNFTDNGVSDLQIPAASDETAKNTCRAKAAPLEVNDTVLTDVQGHISSASDISPAYPSQKSISLATDGSLYSALSSVGGHAGSIRRTFGPQKLLKTENIWLMNPQFAGAAMIPTSLRDKEEIYFFFSEFNKTARVDEEPYRARIGRVCMVDEGGIKALLADSWTTFLKARIMCGAGNTQQQYNNLRQAVVLTAQDKRVGVIYGLFSNAWGKTVICAYSIEDIDRAFSTSKLKGYSSPLTGVRPGMGHLYVGTAMEVQRLTLADCGRYGDTCRECILSRDPYCGWDRMQRKCIPIPPGYNVTTGSLIQNLDQSNSSVCGEAAALKLRKTSPKEVLVPRNTTVFLPCPVRSFHATYRWERDNCMLNYPCLFSGDFCVLGPAVDTPLKEGVFRCMASEDGFKVEVISFRLVNHGPLLAASVLCSLGLSLLLAAATLWLH
ncbi:hypothetical protein WMY93_026567 [Mugilogobius chulae]|uniref:Semaphorin-1A n=1 Tax=Mugilogobius chulae TaxID=88201 RepID=A0AAW0N840_9GOBI